MLEREALRYPLAPFAAEVHGLVREDDDCLELLLATRVSDDELVERAADGGIEVREPDTWERDPEGVAPGTGECVALVAREAHRHAGDPAGLGLEP